MTRKRTYKYLVVLALGCAVLGWGQFFKGASAVVRRPAPAPEINSLLSEVEETLYVDPAEKASVQLLEFPRRRPSDRVEYWLETYKEEFLNALFYVYDHPDIDILRSREQEFCRYQKEPYCSLVYRQTAVTYVLAHVTR